MHNFKVMVVIDRQTYKENKKERKKKEGEKERKNNAEYSIIIALRI